MGDERLRSEIRDEQERIILAVRSARDHWEMAKAEDWFADLLERMADELEMASAHDRGAVCTGPDEDEVCPASQPHHGERGGQQGGSQSASAIASWVQSTFTSTTVGGVTLYDLTAP